MNARLALLLAPAVLLSSTGSAFDLAATHVGGFFIDGSVQNDAAVFHNYYVGYSASESPDVERRNFFIFDLSTVT